MVIEMVKFEISQNHYQKGAWWRSLRRRRLSRTPNSRFLVPISRTGQPRLPSLPCRWNGTKLVWQNKALKCSSTGHSKSLHRPYMHSNRLSRIRGASLKEAIDLYSFYAIFRQLHFQETLSIQALRLVLQFNQAKHLKCAILRSTSASHL